MAKLDVEDADQATLGLKVVHRALWDHKEKVELVLDAMKIVSFSSLEGFNRAREDAEGARVQVLIALSSVDEVYKWITLLADEDVPEVSDTEAIPPSVTPSLLRH